MILHCWFIMQILIRDALLLSNDEFFGTFLSLLSHMRIERVDKHMAT